MASVSINLTGETLRTGGNVLIDLSSNAAKPINGRVIAEADAFRFWSKVDFAGISDCWPWKCGANALGYGKFKLNGKQLTAPRVAFALAEGELPALAFVCHRCDNPRCCNPAHLFLGTAKDNTQDALDKGRMKFQPCDSSKFNIGAWRAEHMPFRGSSHPGAKLNEASVAEIKAALAAGVSGVEIARRFGCSTYTVSNIKTGKQWSHV